jgi:hypothetical protein
MTLLAPPAVDPPTDDPGPAPPGRAPSRRFGLEALLVVGAWCVGALVFFEAQWSSGFNRIMGDPGDARLIVYLNEHWYQVLTHAQSWRSPPIFTPTQGTLGYADSFFLFQIFYAPFRALGADPFLALQLTVIALSLVAFVCFVVFVRLVFRAPLVVAIAGALIFTFATNLSGHSGSFQLLGIYFVPPIALLAALSWRARASRPLHSVALAALVGLLSGLFIFSTYYAAWFTLLAAVIVAVLVVLLSPRAAWSECRAAVRTGWRSLLAVVVGAAVGVIPFLVTYLPVARQEGTRSYSDAIAYAVTWHDLDNLGSGNLLWAHLLHYTWATPSPSTYEFSYAISPLLFLSVVAGGVVLAWAGVTHRLRVTPLVRLTLALCATTVILAVLPVKTRFGSPWAVVWHIPGATAIRAIDRIGVVSDLVAAVALVLVATVAWTSWGRLRHSLPWRVAALVLLCVLVAEQAHDSSATALRRNAQLSALAAVPPAPPGCTSFFVTDSRPTAAPDYAQQTSAMLISQRLGLPTLNGYSGEVPPHWGLTDPTVPTYLMSVRQWETANGLTSGVCSLDLTTDTWHSHPSP